MVLLHVSEYSSTPGIDLTTVVSVGDTMQAKVLKVNDGEGQVLLTYRRLVADNGNKKLEEAFENQTVLTATVSQVMNGGLGVVIDEARVFIPASLVSDTYVKDLSVYKDKEVSFVITEYNPKRRRIIGDCKQLIVAQKEAAQKELLEKIHEGDTIEGTVKNVTDFGAFIDLGGVDGLLHISEMSWGRTENPKKVYKVGDSVKCFIKEINGNKIALSVKYPDSNPWNDAATKYAVGNVVKGKVARMTDFGAFVQLEEGVDALLHVSQIAKEHIEKPSDVLSIGQEIGKSRELRWSGKCQRQFCMTVNSGKRYTGKRCVEFWSTRGGMMNRLRSWKKNGSGRRRFWRNFTFIPIRRISI